MTLTDVQISGRSVGGNLVHCKVYMMGVSSSGHYVVLVFIVLPRVNGYGLGTRSRRFTISKPNTLQRTAVRHRYRTIEFGTMDIHLRTLRDNQQFDDPNGIAEGMGVSPSTWPLFGLIWESGEILARMMFDFDVEGKRILEVGCGIGLSSLVLNSRAADITATDHHPEAGAYLQKNVELNDGHPIPFVRTGWEDESDQLGTFDLIIGSDLLYQPDHPRLLSDFICKHSKRKCQVIVVDPARGNAGKFSQGMIDQGFILNDLAIEQYLLKNQTYKGQVKNYLR